MFNSNPIFTAIFCREENGKYREIGKKKIDIKKDKNVSFEGHTVPVKVNFVSIILNREHKIYYDIDNEVILSFSKTKIPISLGWLDLLLTKNLLTGLFGKLIQGLEEKSGIGHILGYVICIIAGGLGGYIIHSQISHTLMIAILLKGVFHV